MWTKNIELAIEAFNLFCKENVDAEYKLIIGGQVDKKSEKYFNKLTSVSNKDRLIKFIKNPSDQKMNNLYKNCYAAITTSFNEDWGITPIEANAYGKAVISVNSGGYKESQIDGKSGFLTSPNKSEVAKSMGILVNNTNLTRKMGRFARLNSRRFSWITFIEKFERCLKRF